MISHLLLHRGHLLLRKYLNLDKVLEMYLFHLGMIHLLLPGLDLLQEIRTMIDLTVEVKSMLTVKGMLKIETETENDVRATPKVNLKVKTEVKAMPPVNPKVKPKVQVKPKTDFRSALLPHEDSPFLHLSNPSPLYPSLLDPSLARRELNNP